jgi:Amt family ammonium transporter
LAALGGFILIFGFMAFNGSSQGAISNPGDGAAVAMAIKNTVISGTAGAFTTLFMNKLPCFGDRKWSFSTTLNGALAGMVSSLNNTKV